MPRPNGADFMMRVGEVLCDEDRRQRIHELESTRLQVCVAVGIILIHREYYLGPGYRVLGKYTHILSELIGDETKYADVLVSMSRKYRLHRSDRAIGESGNAGWVVRLTPPEELAVLAEEISPWRDLEPAPTEGTTPPDPVLRAAAIVRGIQREGATVLTEVHDLLEKILKEGGIAE